MSITGLAIRKHTTIFVLVLFIVVTGIISYVTLPREAAPEVKIPYIIITTIYPGVAPEDIETLVTREIEKELKTIKDVREITSSSSESFSVIAVEFEPTVEMDIALQRVKDKVDIAKPDLPDDAEEPAITEIDIENMPIINIVLTAEYDMVKLEKIAEDLADEFETIPGVLEARITGDLNREVQIQVDPERLKDYNLSFGDVTGTIMNEDVTIPGGTIDIGNVSYSVRIPGEIKNPYTFADLVVTATPDGPVTISDIADVKYGFEDRTTISRLNGKPAITIGVTKRTGENIIRIADRVKEILEEHRPNLPPGTGVTIQNDFSKFIRVMVQDLENNILNGFVLVMLCIFLFLGVANALFVAIAIPLSMLMSFTVLSLMGYTLNFIVLFALIMSLGMLVDNAIVIVENIYRHRHEGQDAATGAEEGTNEVGIAVTTSTLTTVVAFVPLIFWPGIMGEFMKYLPITVIIVLTASLFVAILINPVFCYRFMQVKETKGQARRASFYDHLIAWYERRLNHAVRHPKTTLGISFAILVVTFLMYGVFGKGVELFPVTDPDAVWIDIKGPVGMRLEATDDIARQLDKTAMTEIPDVANVVTNVGVSTASTGLMSGADTQNEARIFIDFVDFDKRSQPSIKTFQESAGKIEYVTGAEVKLDMEDQGPPVGEPVEVQVSGDDFLELGRIAQDIRRTIVDIPGLIDLQDNFESSKPEIRIDVDREKAAILGLNTSEVAMAVRTAVQGFDAGDFRVGDDDYNITVRFGPEERNSIPDLDRIYVQADDRQIPLSSVASIQTSAGYGTIQRSDLKRVVTITGKNYGRLSQEVLTDVQTRLADYELPAGYDIRYRGENEDAQEASAFLSKALLVALFLIAIVLITQFDSIVLPFIILTSVVLSLIGVMWGLMISGMPFGIIMTGVGVISLAGVVVNNAIVLLDYTIKLRMRGLNKMEAIVKAGKTRFRPVILTALTTIVGLVPLATGWAFDIHTMRFVAGGSSSQWWAPMAIAVVYGLTVATVLTLVVVPALYMIMGKNDEYYEKRARHEVV